VPARREASAPVGGPARIVQLLVVDPDLGVDLSREDAEAARRDVVVPALHLESGEESTLSRRSGDPALIGYLVTAGLLLREVTVAGTVAAELLGTGDLIHPGDVRGSDLSPLRGRIRWTVLEATDLAVLDGSFTRRAASWPQVLARIALRAVWRTHGLALNHAISHQTRVEDRLLLLFWHFAQRWGRVGRDGVRLELSLTHDALGRLVGAQRPSVTTALGMLAERGLLVRAPDRSWVLPLPIPAELEPLLSGHAVSRSAAAPAPEGTIGLAARTASEP
jgi:CRP/FNR family transcriptional regulator, cyclic AMP receptor protein